VAPLCLQDVGGDLQSHQVVLKMVLTSTDSLKGAFPKGTKVSATLQIKTLFCRSCARGGGVSLASMRGSLMLYKVCYKMLVREVGGFQNHLLKLQ
jgi:hypothetical protein